ncbi:hypothetical protein Dsin_032945 [Dipteronia sinensis]|uniref:C-JID domain-containing protein n=1 Tax=Dipteronia sinensis TaxID=43782 RepID=A0AAD9Z605_9ROSI|nr:hypothetical protein Dsin_032945 [Dipteronia sinensis]
MIEELPPSFEDLCRLKDLDLTGCSMLNSLPRSICKWKSLEKLTLLNRPEIDKLPDDIGALKFLEVNLSKPPASVCYPGSEIPEWFDIRSGGSSINVNLSPYWINNFVYFALSAVVAIPDHQHVNSKLRFSCVVIGFRFHFQRKLCEADPPGLPCSKIKLSPYEARGGLVAANAQESGGIPFAERQLLCLTFCDSISFKTCNEIEGPNCDYLRNQFGKPVILFKF